jgi:hypothetical protein
LWRSARSQISLRKKRDGNFFAPFRAGLGTKLIWTGSATTNGTRICARWQEALSESSFRRLLDRRRFAEIARLATNIESRTNLLFSFEKMALRDAVRSPAGAQAFATALFDLLHGAEPLDIRFSTWIAAVSDLPRRQTRVLTWPLVTVFGFLAQPKTHFFFKPMVTRVAARRYGVELPYASPPSWSLYRELLSFVRRVRGDISDMRPRDMIDMQSFLWVQGSDEYPD